MEGETRAHGCVSRSAQACRAQGHAVDFQEVASRNHFDIILEWMLPDTALTRSVAALARA